MTNTRINAYYRLNQDGDVIDVIYAYRDSAGIARIAPANLEVLGFKISKMDAE